MLRYKVRHTVGPCDSGSDEQGFYFEFDTGMCARTPSCRPEEHIFDMPAPEYSPPWTPCECTRVYGSYNDDGDKFLISQELCDRSGKHQPYLHAYLCYG